MRTRPLIWFLLSWISPLLSWGQCSSLGARYAQFNQLNMSDPASVKRGELLLAEWQGCGFNADSVTAKLLHTLGRSYWYGGDFVKGERYTRMAITMNSQGGRLCRRANLANSFTNLGQILIARGHYIHALDALQRAIDIARHFPDKRKTGSVAAEKRATAFNYLGDYEQAAENARLGNELARQAGDTLQQLRNRVQEFQAYYRLKQLQRSQRLIEETLPLATLIDSPADLANILSLAASVHGDQKRPAVAIHYYEKAFALNKQAKNTYGCWQTLINEAYVYQQDKQHQKALQTFKRAEAYAATPVEKALLKAYQSQSIVQQGQPQQALSMLRHALGDFGIRYPSARPDSASIRATDKKEYLLTVLRMEADVLRTLGQKTGRSDYRTEARRTYAVADYVIDLMRWEQQGQQSKLYWRETTHSLYENAIAICYQLNDAPGAYYFIEKSRAVLLTDKLNELGARQQLSPQLANQEQSLSRNVAALRTQLAAQKPGTPAYARIQAKLLLEQEKSDAFVRQMEKINPLYYRYRYANAIRPLAEVREWLTRRNQSVVSYFVGDSALYVLGITPTGNRLIRQAVSGYATSLNQWLALLNNPAELNSHVPQFLQTGHRLYSLVLAPLHLPAEGRVMVSPDGSFFPFEALSRSATQPDYLVRYFAFSYVHSVNRMLSEPPAANRSAGSDRSFVGLAPVEFNSTKTQAALPTLSGSDESLQRVGSHFFMPTLLTGSEATRAQFRALAPTASVVQLFTHADADTLQREPVLYFADSSLHLSDLQTGPAFQTQLLVLSACRTGVGSHQKGEGVFSLARGFSALGVPSVLTTLWSVESSPTYALTEAFYEGLADGLDKDIALQRAKIDWLLRGNSRAAELPHNWAGLILIGDSQPLHKPEGAMAGLGGWIGGGLAGLLGLFLFIRLRRPKNRRHDSPQAGNWKPSLS